MSTITKERITNLLEFNSEGSDCQANAEQWEVHELARIALASLEAEAVIAVGDDGGDALAYRRLIQTFAPGTKLYTAPPAPVAVPDERAAFNAWNNDTDCPLAGRDVKTAAWLAWSRRAAMLQGAENVESRCSNSPVIPDGWKLVPIELTGDMTNAMSEAILDDLHNVDVWRSVLAAAPQQE